MEMSLPAGASGRPARQIAVQAAREAGKILSSYFGVARTVARKGRGNIVTEADLLAEKAIMATLKREFPGHGILSEESPEETGSTSYTWVIDPLDGTMNFSLGLPLFAVAIALVEAGEPVLGVVYDPIHRDLFVGERGRGATRGGRRIHVNDRVDLDTATVGLDLGYDEEARRLSLAAATVARPAVQTIRVIGSAVLGHAYVACGRFDLYFHNSLYPWDIAAARILVQEAGALVTGFEGQPVTIFDRSTVVANPGLHRAFLEVVSEVQGVAS